MKPLLVEVASGEWVSVNHITGMEGNTIATRIYMIDDREVVVYKPIEEVVDRLRNAVDHRQ